ncbi:MAG: indole-3-glycerol phosphate synthase TrpC [Syntrophomonas sp.]|uniref:indole-3-glycerol phosphate synthase TrpC n=1 Tax=Syntrophomonas sp. TaxID=2053627 RepID=UPI002605E94B|nr:indole-3-glycerol phosphate synthase TrpC [Syntrophomonas sp.]MDD2510086.1 indole-3-glycerol phosphate synthase TrpC [Syntrophomonas sp.]MDD3878719.1 indole-3-glycerol phosphate synthase TrpC [Syntrophomonas sp.]MDD4627075.1 indole-3-glycerol phosphate synthase TrpC [Syntrophomonas sp.]
MLKTIAEAKLKEVERLRQSLDIAQVEAGDGVDRRNLSRNPGGKLQLIAEIKKASPLKGLLCSQFSPLEMARSYETNGAAGISVITEEEFFDGRREYLPLVKSRVKLPVLRKDFVINEVQIYESRQMGADLLLLIAALHDYDSLLALLEKCSALGMEPLLETHGRDEIKMALDLPVKIIGINNRNLRDFSVDIRTSLDLLHLIPDSCLKVSESGIREAGDLLLLESSGCDFALVGEALVTAPDPGAKLRELLAYRQKEEGL